MPKAFPQIPPYGDNAINVLDLSFSYRNDGNFQDPNAVRHVLKDLNLVLRKGSRCLLIGANDSGKSVRLARTNASTTQ